MTISNYIIVGCGRLGSTVAKRLDSLGNEVAIVDRKRDAFRRLGTGFTGKMITGVGFDRDVLRDAGICETSAVVAATNGDNSNILVARVAREMFGAERVVARIYDPRRAAIYERLGIQTVATVSWASKRVFQLILPQQGEVEWVDPTAHFTLIERHAVKNIVGMKMSDLGVHVALLVRNGRSSIPAPSLLVQEGDALHLLGTNAQLTAFDAIASSEKEHS